MNTAPLKAVNNTTGEEKVVTNRRMTEQIDDVIDYKDFLIECYWTTKPRSKSDMKCRTTPVDADCGTTDISDDTKELINEFVFERVNPVKHKMCDVGKVRVFPQNDVPPVFLLLVEPLADSTPHEHEVPFFA